VIDLKFGDHIEFEYTNWKGETETRRVCIHRIAWGRTEYHPQPQAIMFAHCMDRRADRGFALRDMANVRRWSPFAESGESARVSGSRSVPPDRPQ
jgi:hypothetical protein